MEQLKGTPRHGRSKRVVVIVVCLAGTLILSACQGFPGLTGYTTSISGTIADRLKPDVNNEKLLLLDPTLVVNEFNGVENNPYSNGTIGDHIGDDGGGDGGDDDTSDSHNTKPSTPPPYETDRPPVVTHPEDSFGPDTPGGDTGGDSGDSGDPGASGDHGGTPGGKPVEDLSPGLPTDLTPWKSYSRYLREKVIAPLDKVIGSNRNVYYRVMALGPDLEKATVTTTFPRETKEVTRLTSNSILDSGNRSSLGKKTWLAGEKMSTLALEYFGQLAANENAVTDACRKAIQDFKSANITGAMHPEDVPENSSFRKTDAWKIWHCGEYDTLTADEFMSELENADVDNCLGLVPGLALSYYSSSGGSKASVNVCDTTNTKNWEESKDEYYNRRQTINAVNALFSHSTQFTNHTMKDILDYSSLDAEDGSLDELLKVYIDGYYTVIIYVGTVANGEESMGLEAALNINGDTDAFQTVSDTIDGALMPYEFAEIMSAGYTFDVMPAGTK